MKRIILVFTAALLLTAMTVAVAPAMAQEEKKEETKTEEKKGDDKDKDKDKDKEKDLPKSGGLPINASLLGLGAGVLLVGGGLVAVRVARQDRR
jgi:Ni/Co efflux regulator RcnB